jgi:deoxyribodipyrimidine photo-lyase
MNLTLSHGQKIRDNFIKKEINFKYFKGNTLNEFQDVKKNDGTPFKVFTPFWRTAEQIYLNSVPTKISKIQKKDKKFTYFKNNINPTDILPKKKLV